MSVEALGTGGLWRFFDSLANFPNVWVGIIVGITIMLVSHGIYPLVHFGVLPMFAGQVPVSRIW